MELANIITVSRSDHASTPRRSTRQHILRSNKQYARTTRMHPFSCQIAVDSYAYSHESYSLPDVRPSVEHHGAGWQDLQPHLWANAVKSTQSTFAMPCLVRPGTATVVKSSPQSNANSWHVRQGSNRFEAVNVAQHLKLSRRRPIPAPACFTEHRN